MQNHLSTRAPLLYLIAALCVTTAVYWIGLYGPFVLDDAPNFGVIRDWHAGNRSLADTVFSNTSIFTHRALSMASFAASTAIHGYDPFGFKLDNLLLHLLCGALMYRLAGHLFQRDSQLATHARLAAAIVASIWLLHPFHASTVLYAVQRMAQWATILSILGLLLYVHVRLRLEQGNTRHALAALFVLFPALVFLGVQGKQNAAALPLLCLVVELGYFQCSPRRWPRQIQAFFALFLLLPGIAAVALLAARPELLLAGYSEYEFTLGQRLLSEARVLFAYIGQILAPHTPSMGVFTDSYEASTGLLSPATTLYACLGLLAVSAIAILARSRLPAFFTGWFFFLAAHSVEGTVLPLELYYEHRNYLPMLGILMMCASLACAAGQLLLQRGVRAVRVGIPCIVILTVALAAMTHGRARVWSDALVLVGSELRNNPESYRVVAYNVGTAVTAGDMEYAYAVANRTIATTGNARLKGQAALLRVWLDCSSKNQTSRREFDQAMDTLPGHLDLNTFVVIDQVAAMVEKKMCGELDDAALAEAIRRLVDRTTSQPDQLNLKWAMRNRAAFLFANAGRWEDAQGQARLGWQPGTPGDGAAPLVEIHLVQGNLDEAEKLLATAIRRTQSQPKARAELEQMWPLVEAERRSPGFNRARVDALPGTQ